MTPIVEPAAAGRIRLITAPYWPRAELAGPGACVVVVAEIAGSLRIEVNARRPQGSLDAVLQLELLQNAMQGGAQQAALPRSPQGLRFLAHVSRRGDVEFGEGAWAGGPETPAALEGLTILSGAVEARALSLSAGGRRWTAWTPPGVFLGSRGQSQPLYGLSLRLLDGQDPDAELAVEAMFVGSPIVRKQGRMIEVVGPYGMDPLVGLRISMSPTSGRRLEPSQESLSAPEPRVQAFRPRVGKS